MNGNFKDWNTVYDCDGESLSVGDIVEVVGATSNEMGGKIIDIDIPDEIVEIEDEYGWQFKKYSNEVRKT